MTKIIHEINSEALSGFIPKGATTVEVIIVSDLKMAIDMAEKKCAHNHYLRFTDVLDEILGIKKN